MAQIGARGRKWCPCLTAIKCARPVGTRTSAASRSLEGRGGGQTSSVGAVGMLLGGPDEGSDVCSACHMAWHGVGRHGWHAGPALTTRCGRANGSRRPVLVQSKKDPLRLVAVRRRTTHGLHTPTALHALAGSRADEGAHAHSQGANSSVSPTSAVAAPNRTSLERPIQCAPWQLRGGPPSCFRFTPLGISSNSGRILGAVMGRAPIGLEGRAKHACMYCRLGCT